MKTGKRILDLNDLHAAAMARQSVVCRQWYRKRGEDHHYLTGPTPAAFMQNRIGSDLRRMINDGMFIYKPETKLDLDRPPRGKAPKHSVFNPHSEYNQKRNK
jgi:hypothetical protein